MREALADFRQQFPHGADFRDYLTHFDKYALGEGRRQAEGHVPREETAVLESWRVPAEQVVVRFGTERMALMAAGRAAAELASVAAVTSNAFQEQWLRAFPKPLIEG